MSTSNPVGGMGGTAWDRHTSRLENKDRLRWYGLRPGDIVDMTFGKVTIRGRVETLHGTDNNGCTIVVKGRGRMKAVCEWCEIVQKVEDQ